MKLRPYQKDSLAAVKANYLAGVNRQVIKLPTGCGKSCVFAKLPDELGFDKKILVTAHREELIFQAADKLRKWNPGRTVGIEMGDLRSNGEQLIVASIQSIGNSGSKRLQQFDPADFDAVVVDEVHHALGKTYLNVFDHFRVYDEPQRLLLGFTATTKRGDGQGLNKVFQEIAYDMSILDAIRQGWLVDLKGIRIKTKTSLDAVHTKAGDFQQDELSETVNTPTRNEAVVRGWLEHGQDRQTIGFAVDIAHAKALAETFKRYGVSAEAVWGVDPDRKDKLKFHREGAIKVLVNCELLTEGYDDWRVGCILLARPTQSETLYTQIVGRGTRIPEGIDNLVEARKLGLPIPKEDCIVIDTVDLTDKHSLISLPSLFGLRQDMNLRGRTITSVLSDVEQIKAAKPFVDVSNVEDINNLQSYAEQVDLFRITPPPEIIQISEFMWHRSGSDAYVLLLPKGESVSVVSDVIGRWYVVGTVNENKFYRVMDSFESAIREGDYKVKLFGGRSLKSIARQKSKWNDLEPSPDQLWLAKKMHINVPAGATRGELAKRLAWEIDQRKKKEVTV